MLIIVPIGSSFPAPSSICNERTVTSRCAPHCDNIPTLRHNADAGSFPPHPTPKINIITKIFLQNKTENGANDSNDQTYVRMDPSGESKPTEERFGLPRDFGCKPNIPNVKYKGLPF